jgi:hypothetical protein
MFLGIFIIEDRALLLMVYCYKVLNYVHTYNNYYLLFVYIYIYTYLQHMLVIIICLYIFIHSYCDMFRPNTVIAMQWEVKTFPRVRYTL